MQTARLIVLLAGVTHWVRWELRQVIQRGYAGKLIVLMPELSRFKGFKASLLGRFSSVTNIATARVEAMRESFQRLGVGGCSQ